MSKSYVMHFVPDAIPSGTVFKSNRKGSRTIEVRIPKRQRRRRHKAPKNDSAGEFLRRVRSVIETLHPNLSARIRIYEHPDVPAGGAVRIEADVLPKDRGPLALVLTRDLRRFGFEPDLRITDAGVAGVVTEATDQFDPWMKRIVDGRPFA